MNENEIYVVKAYQFDKPIIQKKRFYNRWLL